MRKFILTSESQGDNFIGRIKTGGMGATYEKIAGESTILGGGLCKPMQSVFVWYPDKFRINLPSFRYLFDKLIIEHQGEFNDATNQIFFAYDQRDPLQVMEIEYPIEMLNIHPLAKKEKPREHLYGGFNPIRNDLEMLQRLHEAMANAYRVVDPEYMAPANNDRVVGVAEGEAVPPEQVVHVEPRPIPDDYDIWAEMADFGIRPNGH